MNQKTAFKILGLSPGASLAQVKKSFRDLAKQYHPDRSPTDEMGAVPAEVRLNRMKEVNQAFHFLVPLLTPADIPPFPSRENKAKATNDKASGYKNFSFLDILNRFKKGFSFYRKPGSPPRSFVRSPLRPSAPQQNRSGKTARFSAILKSLHPDGPYNEKTKGCGRDGKPPYRDSRDRGRASGNPPYNSFLKYMALKKQIDARRRPRGEQTCSRIEKIRPVTRVNPIGNKQNS